ncbi:MAG TPA: aminotransferase class V-fold PLP-dependent enzyme [Acidobacteriota bacterium]|jgi:L-seryl-tRNA(Ser) seleniumtransferase
MNRRFFLKAAGAISGLGAGFRPGTVSALSSPHIYSELGIKPFINAAGTYTTLSGSVMADEVRKAMEQAGSAHVSIPELQAAVGKRIAEMVGAEGALVTAGCAAALTLATAACIAGKDPEKIRRVPDTSGLKNEVICQKTHRVGYDHAIRNVGAKIIEVETRDQLMNAVSDRTAMFFFLNYSDPRGNIKREEYAQIANRLGIPCLIDAAADLPPIENLRAFTRIGFDLAAFSGGKGLCGPQCSGLLIGKKQLIEAAFLNGSPHSDSVGRVAKVGKEEIVGLYKALQLYLRRDQKAQWEDWERRVSVIDRELGRVAGLKTERFVPVIANGSPHLRVQWNPQQLPLTARQVVERLRSGEPRIELRPGSEEGKNMVEVSVWMLHPGEEKIVARRIRETFKT